MPLRHFLILLLLSLSLPPLAMASNQLAGSDSPYLAMHGDDPVDWHIWSADALAQAKRENKLLFVSIGYFACHWCHVMQRESYRDEAVAKLLNAHFVSVKVDRELNPALDAYLIDFVQRTRGAAGWPLNVFLTPDGHPLVGTTYLPKARFVAVLEQLQHQWAKEPDYLRQVAARAVKALKGEPPPEQPPLKPGDGRRYENLLVQQALQLADEMSGGFGEQAKFPLAPHLSSLIAAYARDPEAPQAAELRRFLLLTLERMATQGLRDNLGGGFFRYTVDPGWQTPHFEKMLYGNALLASVYLQAARVFGRADFEAVARDTLDFLLREMRTPEGAMVASFSAVDTANVEGGYYLWRTETLAETLDADELKLVQLYWGLEGEPELEAGNLPRVRLTLDEAAQRLGLKRQVIEQRLRTAREKLLAVRARRSLPVDSKRLAAWNGLALTALVEGARLPGGERYRAAARGLRDFLTGTLWDGERLWRARGRHGELGQAGLEDYAFAAQGLLAWADLSGDAGDRKLARRWVDDAWRRFHDASGWQRADQTLLPAGYGVAMFDDSPLPSPSAVLLRVSLALAARGGDQVLGRRVAQALAAGHGELEEAAFDYAGQVSLLADWEAGRRDAQTLPAPTP